MALVFGPLTLGAPGRGTNGPNPSRPGRLVAATACPGRHETPGTNLGRPLRPPSLLAAAVDDPALVAGDFLEARGGFEVLEVRLVVRVEDVVVDHEGAGGFDPVAVPFGFFELFLFFA